MFTKKARRWNVLIIAFLLTVYVVAYYCYEVYLRDSLHLYEYVHVFLHMLVVAFSVAISVLMWHVARMRKQRELVLMGAFFLLLSVLQITLLLLADQIIFNALYNYTGLAIFLNTITMILLPGGGIIVSIWQEKTITLQYRNRMYAASFVVSMLVLLGSYLIFLNEWYLWDAQQGEMWKKSPLRSHFYYIWF